MIVLARQRKPFSIRDECGQSLLVVALSMGIIIGIAALAIDVSSWYQHTIRRRSSRTLPPLRPRIVSPIRIRGRPRNALRARTRPTRRTSQSTYAGANGLRSTATTSSSTPRAVPSRPPPQSTHRRSSRRSSTSARAHQIGERDGVLGWSMSLPFPCLPRTAAAAPTLGIQAVGNGGGTDSIFGLHSNGEYFNGNNSGSTTSSGRSATQALARPRVDPATNRMLTSSAQASANCWKNNGIDDRQFQRHQPGFVSRVLPRTCDDDHSDLDYELVRHSADGSNPGMHYPRAPGADYWTTDCWRRCQPNHWAWRLLRGSSTNWTVESFSGTSAPSTERVTGSIYVSSTNSSGTSSLTGTSGYEFVGPCVTLNSAAERDAVRPVGWSACLWDGQHHFVGDTGHWIIGNGATLQSPVFDPLGTVDFTSNNDFVGFVEAQNIVRRQEQRFVVDRVGERARRR